MKTRLLITILILSVFFVIASDKSYATYQSPEAVLTADPVYVTVNDTNVTLDGSSSYDPDGGSITKYEWDWTADGTYDYNETPGDGIVTHSYSNAGIYTVRLRVTDNEQSTSTDTCTVYYKTPIYVPQDVTTIQGAIDAALDGSTIIVSKGTYDENDIDFGGKEIILTSTDPNDWEVVARTIIKANDSSASVFVFDSSEDASSVLRGFTITGGDRGIECDGASPKIENCVIAGNSSSGNGGGMYCVGSSSAITNVFFLNNSSDMAGGAIYNISSGTTITSCVFSGNTSTTSGGAIRISISSPTFNNCTVYNNSAGSDGGGIYTYGASSQPILTN